MRVRTSTSANVDVEHPAATIVDEVISSRRSVRAFTSRPVPRDTIEAILAVAARAPSGSNAQPWKVHVLFGAEKDALSASLVQVHDDARLLQAHQEDFPYHPPAWFEPYLSRRRKTGWGLYGLLGIGREDRKRMHAQHGRNFLFFDAPVGLIFTIDRRFERGSWLEYGMFLQNVMIAARARGLDTCAQAAFNRFGRIIAARLALPPEDTVVCGMSLGYADTNRPENALRTERVPVEGFATFWED